MASTFHRETVRLPLLAGDDCAIRNAVFKDCEIRGPAVIVPSGSTFTDGHFEGTNESVIWDLPSDRKELSGAILVEDCRFAGCRFIAVGVAGPPAMLDEVRKALTA